MKPFALLVALILGYHAASAQAAFQSDGSGNWDDPATWTPIDGSSSPNYPVAGDTVTLTNAYTVTIDVHSQCSNLDDKRRGVLKMLVPGTNDISRLSQGMYFVKSQDALTKFIKE